MLKKLILLNSAVVLLITLAIGIALQYTVSPGSTRWFLLLVPILAFVVNFIGYLSAASKSLSRNFNTLISALFGVKFFSYLILALVYFILEKENHDRLVFISFIFIVYILNTIVLLRGVLKFQKSIS
jgi:hypothetical protein